MEDPLWSSPRAQESMANGGLLPRKPYVFSRDKENPTAKSFTRLVSLDQLYNVYDDKNQADDYIKRGLIRHG